MARVVQNQKREAKVFKMSLTEKVSRFITEKLRKVHFFNKQENIELTCEFEDMLVAIKEYNSKIVWDSYYLPKAINAILKEEGYLTSEKGAAPRAKAMLLADLANGTLDEFYRFK